jgi:hypothetical protein
VNANNIPKYVYIGRNDVNWYQECQAVFEQLFGPEKLELVCALFAATSINTSLKSNITLFRKAYYEIENNLPIGRYLPNIQRQLAQVRAGQPLTGLKIDAFRRAMSGDQNAVVVDIHLLRAFEMDSKYFRQTKGKAEGIRRNRSSGATPKQFAEIEKWVREATPSWSVEPRQLSAMIWSGCRISKTGDKETHYKTILKHKLTNLFNVI